MSDGTLIEWTDATVNAINGCTVLSPGCTNCYAMRLAGTRLRDHPSRAGLTSDSKAGPVWNGTVRLNESALLQPLRWKRPRRIFWNAHGDIFHPSVTDAWIDRCFAVMALTPHHIHQLLTKRSDRMRTYLSSGAANRRIARVIIDWLVDGTITKGLRHCATWPVRSIGDIDDPTDITVDLPLPNVWLGVSVEDQKRALERIPDLLATPAAVRWLSCEPLLGPIDLGQLLEGLPINAWLTWLDALNWVVVGGESGPGARPMHPDWARDLRDQCAAAYVPFFFKQWGDWSPGENVQRQSGWVNGAHWFDNRWLFEEQNLSATDGHIDDEPDLYRVGKRTAGRLLDGVQHDGMPR
ncbi:MAG: phage Gp37/Gp68 family protein [Sphingobium sp.]|nr:phage Gp37/Gp68 family protein [Sphingobium sp.]